MLRRAALIVQFGCVEVHLVSDTPLMRNELLAQDAADATLRAPAGTRGVAPVARTRLARAQALLDSPLVCYYLLVGCTVLLLALGLAVVLSASTAQQLLQGASTYAPFGKQVVGAVIGIVIMGLLARAPIRLLRAFAYPLLAASVLGLFLVLLAGPKVSGVQRWVDIAGFQVQPSEFAKLALVLWGADLLARKQMLRQLTDARQLLIPLLPGLVLLGLLVMAGDDLGTTFLLVVIFLTLLWVIGTPVRLLAGVIGMMIFVILVLIVVQPWRMERISGLFGQSSTNCTSCWQLQEGKYALGSGGWFGVGLGESKSAWGWVPNPTTDFIFAILGEELGLFGTVCVIALYGGIAFAGLCIARRVGDTFARLAASAITIWIIAQALVNIGAVLGVLPITGVPLPLISAGVSSLLVTLAALGILVSFARSVPGARQALAAAGPGTPLRMLLHWLGIKRR